MTYRKVYIGVIASFSENGILMPKEIIWENGYRYPIEKVTCVCQAASLKTGGQGDRYTVILNGREKYLFFERNASLAGNNIGKWYVEQQIS